MRSPANPQSAFDRLTPRQQTCLELTAQLYSAKEIANRLSLQETTVESYLAEATRLIGAKNKREAARLYAQVQSAPASTRKIGGDSSRLSVDLQSPPEAVDEEAGNVAIGRNDGERAGEPAVDRQKLSRFHLLRGERQYNDLTTAQRLAWIVIVAVAAAILFTSSISIIDSLHRILAGQ